MVKFRDLNNNNSDSTEQSRQEKNEASREKLHLSFRKLAAEEKTLVAERVASEALAPEQDLNDESGKVLYQKASAYLKKVLEAVKQQEMFLLDPGFQIIREIVDIPSFQDSLFIEALHFDDPLQFIINNNVNVAIYAIKMAENLGWSKDRRIEIGMAGLLHDVGMALIPPELLHKQQSLSKAESDIFKERSNHTYKILKSFGADYTYLAVSAAQANERIDGSGYPQGLKGDEIHEYAQIIGLVDFYEALIHSRPQREKFHHFIAVKEVIKSGKYLFQRKHLKALLNIFFLFPIYSYVRLNSNAIGRVIETYPDQPMRPRIQILFDSQQRQVLIERIVNLPDDPLLYLVDSVSDEDLQQLSERSDRTTEDQTDTEPKDHDLDSDKVEAALVDDESTLETQADEDQKDQGRKTGWLKLFLIIAAIILLAAGLIIQIKNKDSKPLTQKGAQDQYAELLATGIQSKVVEL